jgi:drug/metabolite transporter (DMT)-like permease
MNPGPVFALLAAVLFGVSPVLAKATIGEMSPFLLAGLLYLGSGLGLLLILVIQKNNPLQELKALKSSHRFKLLGAIVAGGVIAPLCLAFGLKMGSAFEVSLLLNLETVATTLIASLVFHENVGREVWIGKVLLIIGAAIIAFHPGTNFAFSPSALIITGACLFWGIDNNLTRDVEDLSPSVLGCVKGLSAGLFNTLLAFLFGVGIVGSSQVLSSLGIGALSYGLSLVLFVMALRTIGSSRTSTYFAIGPFVGMFCSILFLGERPPLYQWIAPIIMILGLISLYREKHSHIHVHQQMTHSHKHFHDEHHQHSHNGTEGSEPHEHFHTHESLSHDHVHFPDIHHRHRH